ncbi:MAG: cell wall-binding repeat-containing protein [Actinobacteria bacterium]|nr:cell wall-binding repeat-containing protein [Actinomycetota bacterium]
MKAILASAVLTAVFMVSISAEAPFAGAAPPNQPMTIVSEGFESTLSAAWQLGPWVDPVRPSTAHWGRMSNVRRTGSFSLWCAGTRANDSPGVWGYYPAATGGHARLNLPQLADYYSSEVSFHYTMPTVGAADFFTFSWHADGALFGDTGGEVPTTGAGVWLQRRLVFSSAANTANLSRTPGSMRFQFLDNVEGPLQLPATGQGPSIDDLVVTGYKYGPVRNLSATTTNTAGIVLRWERPIRAVGSSEPEEREISYRIWRRPTGAGAWTELPRAGNGDLSHVDTSAVAGVQYEYSVVAHDPIPGFGYGQPGAAAQGVRPILNVATFTLAADSTTIKRRWPVRLTYRAENTSLTNITNITLRDSFAGLTGSDVFTRLDPGQVGIVERTRFQRASGDVTATLTGIAGSDPITITVGLRITVKDPPRRVSGNDRIDTAIAVAREAFPEGADNVIIVYGWNYPDALSASALAGALDAPILLVRTASSGAAVLQAIRDLGVKQAYIVGGYGVVSTGVEREIDSLPGVSVAPRIYGINRFATAGAVAREVSKITTPTTVFLATGHNFPDALAASSLAARGRWPILLTNTAVLSPETDHALRSIRPERVVILGGYSVVSLEVENAIRGNSAYGSPEVIRRAGINRYETARQVIGWGVSATGGNLAPSGIDGLHLATGENFPDALPAGVLAGRPKIAWWPLMLTHPTVLSPAARGVIMDNRGVSHVTVIGGIHAVSSSVESAARNLIAP